VYGIAAHKVADAHRSAARNRAEPVPEIPDSPALADGPEQRAMQGELAEQMTRLLGTLPDKQREILVLRVVIGLSAEETAEAVGSTPGAVRVSQHRALSRLRKTLSAEAAPNDKDIDNLLTRADRALHEKLHAPSVEVSKPYEADTTEDEYIDQLLRIADTRLRQKLGMSGSGHFEQS
jgi:RNA polymerase sigma-70 factor (ECF subfamily)